MADEIERQAWITLASVEGVGSETMGALLAEFGSARVALEGALDGRLAAWIAERRRIDGRPPIISRTFANLQAAARDPSSRLTAVAGLGLWTFTALDGDYPNRLRDLDPPPAVIHGLGDQSLLSSRRAVAVVGTRRPTPFGRSLTARICARLVECGATVISGLAVGIDGAAHSATIERGGRTVGVIGAGHHHPGPRAHTRLRAEVLARGGAIIGEHHPDTKATKGTYPRRNRIIAALADAVIVVEAPRTSGALITARHALELGRLVLVSPGRVGEWATVGSLALLRETPARPLVGLDEMVEDLGYFASPPAEADGVNSIGAHAPALEMLGTTEQAIARRLMIGPAGLDALVADTGLAPGVVSGAMTLLLMRGWAQSIGPAYICAGPLAR
jgi:DNA processing protein